MNRAPAVHDQRDKPAVAGSSMGIILGVLGSCSGSNSTARATRQVRGSSGMNTREVAQDGVVIEEDLSIRHERSEVFFFQRD